MSRGSVLVLVSLLVGACGGGGEAALAVPLPPEAPAAPAPVPQPQLPAVAGEVIGLPGAAVPGLDASYVTTGLGWLGPDDDVVFEAVIQWRSTLELGCGILRRGPDGRVNTVLMQGQPLPGTGGRVKHPQLPLEARGDTLVIPALVDGGAIERGLFAVPKGGGAPVLLAAEERGEFAGARIGADGTVVAEIERPEGSAIVVVPPGGAADVLCEGCDPGFSTDGVHVVVRRAGVAWAVALDGAAEALLAAGEPAPGSLGRVVTVRRAWVTPGGEFVVQATTDDPARPEVLLRVGAEIEVVAACGAPAPGTDGLFGAIYPAAGADDDVVFGAEVDGDPRQRAAIFCARPGFPAELVVADGATAMDLPGPLAVSAPDAVGEGGRIAFLATVFEGIAPRADGVFVASPAGTERILTTDAPVEAVPGGTLSGFLFAPRDAIRLADDGRTLVHVGIREARRPDALLGALLLVR